jgi:NtrC-family two-component system sensor histidine kinase KinB
MVARRSASDSGDLSTEERLREALAEHEGEIRALRAKLADHLAIGRDFLSDAAHAIRSPLTVTHSYLEILHTDLTDGLNDEQLSFLGIAYENVVRLRRLVEDLVDLAALETGAAQIDVAPAAIDEIINSLREDSRSVAEEKDLELVTEVANGLPAISVDQDRLRDVLRRLLDNAIRFTPGGGSIRIQAGCDQDLVALSIEDNGVGIPADRVTEVFQPFVQIHRRPGENRETYGLGLALCRRQIDAFGGTLELESTEGEGTTVTIKLPVPVNE